MIKWQIERLHWLLQKILLTITDNRQRGFKGVFLFLYYVGGTEMQAISFIAIVHFHCCFMVNLMNMSSTSTFQPPWNFQSTLEGGSNIRAKTGPSESTGQLLQRLIEMDARKQKLKTKEEVIEETICY